MVNTPHFPLSPDEIARWLKEFVEVDGVRMVGGCCGTTPKHLAAICAWEGAADFYRDVAYHGGIFCNGFTHDWPPAQIY